MTILDNDTSLQFSAPTFSVNEDGTPVAAVTVTRTGSSAGTASATVNLTNGTATAPGDYSNTPIPVNFASGDTAPKTIVKPVPAPTTVSLTAPAKTPATALTPTVAAPIDAGTTAKPVAALRRSFDDDRQNASIEIANAAH